MGNVIASTDRVSRTRSAVSGIGRNRRVGASLLAAALLLLAAPVEAQQVVVGRVTDELFDMPLEGVQVMFELRDADDEGTLVVTDAEGRFAALLPGPGDYLLRTLLRRYEPTLYPLTVEASDETIEIVVQLAPEPVELDGIFVEVEAEERSRYLERVGFTRRSRSGFGDFLDADDLEGPRANLLQLFTGVPNLRATPDALRMFFRPGSGRSGWCTPTVWVDGLPIEAGASLSMVVSAPMIDAVEIYRVEREIPLRYRLPRQGCGTVLIWTDR